MRCFGAFRFGGRLAGGAVLTRLFVFVTLVLLVLPFWQARLRLAEHQHDVGHADKAAYAQRARSLVEGRWGRVPYVTNFYRRYDPGIWRHDDHWPAFPAWLLVPSFHVRGVDAAHARATMLTVGAALLPLAAAWLAVAATGHAWAGLPAAILMLLPVAFLKESFEILGDVPLAAVTAAFGAAVLSSRRRPAWLVVGGLLAACAALTKGSHLLLGPLLPAFAVLIHGPRILLRRSLLGGVLLFLLVMAPGWVRTARDVGNPLHSTQNHVAAFFGLQSGPRDRAPFNVWDPNFYAVYWGRNLPGLRDRFADLEAYWLSLRQNSEPYLRVALLGPDASANDWEALGRAPAAWSDWLLLTDQPVRPAAPDKPLVASPTGWPAPHFTIAGGLGLVVGAVALAMFPVAALAGLLRRRRDRNGDRDAGAAIPPRLANAVILAVLVGVQAGFVIVAWSTLHRFTFTILPPLYALALIVPAALLDKSAVPIRALAHRRRWLRKAGPHVRWVATLLVCGVTAGLWLPGSAARAEQQRSRAGIPILAAPHYPAAYRVARWIEENLPEDAVVMTRYPWQLTFYCAPGIRAVGLPYATPDVLFAVARYYNVTHLIYDRTRPGMHRFLASRHPALTRLAIRPSRIYAIDYDAFGPGELADLDALDTPNPPR